MANGLTATRVMRGEAVAIMMPMNLASVAIYLGIVQAGRLVVSIADSFAADQIATRLRIANVKLIFTQSFVWRGAKRWPLYQRVVDAGAPPTVVLSNPPDEHVKLRPADRSWRQFLSDRDRFDRLWFQPDDTINILFSSGTTGEPKAIP